MAQLVKYLHAMQETPVRFMGQEDLLEKGQSYPLQEYPLQNSWASRVAQLVFKEDNVLFQKKKTGVILGSNNLKYMLKILPWLSGS